MRYLAALRPNGRKHQIDVLDVSFSESTPTFVEVDSAKASAVMAGIKQAGAKDGKCPGIDASIVFVPEAALKGRSPEQFLEATKAPTAKQLKAKEAAEKAAAAEKKKSEKAKE